ncbi:MAG: TRAP transporter small permease subunit [Atribacterota bacterium]|jgi:TRAP-type C4-dicarboxylate transport system permease small subunit
MENKFDKILFKFIKTLISLLLVLMFAIIIIGIFFRYIINIPIFGTEEFARYIMFYMVMLGSAVAFREEKHPALLFVIQKFPIKFLRVWNFIKDIIIIIILIIIFKEGYLMAVDEMIMISPALRISFFWVYLAFPIGALLMIFQIIANYIFGKKSFKIEKKTVQD